MVKLKENVTGFIYDSVYGYVKTIFDKPLKNNFLVCGDDVLVDDNDTVNMLFVFESKDELDNSDEGLNEVLEWCE